MGSIIKFEIMIGLKLGAVKAFESLELLLYSHFTLKLKINLILDFGL